MSDQTIEGKLIVTDRVGIGTERPEPETQLHISPTNKDGKIYLESGGNLLQVIVNSTIATIGTSGNFPLQLQANLNQSKFSGIYINNGGNVGIGTTTPSFNLDVQGIINATQFNKNGQRWKITDDDIDDNTISGKKIKPRSISQDRLDFTIGGSQWVSGSSSSISYNSGNVGIGNSSPSFNLDVAGIINATQFNKNGQRWKITDDDIDDNTISGKKIKPRSISQDKLDFTIGGSQWISGSSGSISYNSGNVGIGNPSPSFNLDVQGIINATQFNKNGSPWIISRNEIDNKAINADKIDDSAVSNIKIANKTITGDKIADKTITKEKLAFDIPSGGGSSQWQGADGGPISYTKGNVGIGTNNPQDKLDLAGNLRILTDSNPIRFTSAWSGFPDSKPNQAEISNDTGNFKTLMIVGNKSAGGVRRVSVWDKLEINGALVPSAGNSETAGIMFPKDPFTGGGDAAWIRYYARTGEATTLEIGTSNDPDDHIALMPNAGNVGIDTNNPQAPLHISTSQTTLRLQSTQPTQNNERGGKARIEFWSDPQFSKTEWQQAVIESSDSDDLTRAFRGVLSFYVNRSSGDVNDNQIRPKKVMSMNENRVDVTGELYVNGTLVQSSSRYLKENITDFSTQEAIEALADLNPVKFNYREDKQKEPIVGFIAEDVPELVATADRKGICPLEIVAVLTKVIQQQQDELSCLKERLNVLEASV